MTEADTPQLVTPRRIGPAWLHRWVEHRPEIPFIAPFLGYLVLMSCQSLVEDDFYRLHFYVLRTVGGLGLAAVFWSYYPPMGRLHPGKCIVFGVGVAYMWVMLHRLVAGQYVDGEWLREPASWYVQPLGSDASPDDYFDPRSVYGSGAMYWFYLIVRIGGASTTVPIVEELFWRAFMLRALIDWDEFDKVKLGAFTLKSFLLCSVMSALEHPQWEVGIVCWMIYNALFYWTRSLKCLIVTHGITNLVLYIHVVAREDWVFWS
jgi:CAAX protease family protein